MGFSWFHNVDVVVVDFRQTVSPNYLIFATNYYLIIIFTVPENVASYQIVFLDSIFRAPACVTQSRGVILSAPKSRTREVENSHILSIC